MPTAVDRAIERMKRRAEAIRKVADVIDANPEAALQVIRAWLAAKGKPALIAKHQTEQSMSTTSFSTNHALAVKLWAKMLNVEALKEAYVSKFIAKGSGALKERGRGWGCVVRAEGSRRD